MCNDNNPKIQSNEDGPLFPYSASVSESVKENQSVQQSKILEKSAGWSKFSILTSIPPKVNRAVYNMIKGHRLLFWCIIFLLMVYGIEMRINEGKVSPAGEKIIEILKLLIFSVSGYLFGTHENEKKDC